MTRATMRRAFQRLAVIVSVSSLAVGLGLLALIAIDPGPGESGVARASGPVVIDIGSDWFCDPSFQDGVCQTAIQPGDTVQWRFSAGIHNATECGDNWSKGSSCAGTSWGSDVAMIPPSTFSHTFTTPGSYFYRCTLHPDKMKGIIEVAPAATPTPTPSPTPAPTASPAPTPQTPSPTAEPSPAPTSTSAPTQPPTPTPAAATPQTGTPSPSPTGSGSTPTPSPTVTPTSTLAPSQTPAATPRPSVTAAPTQQPDPATPNPAPDQPPLAAAETATPTPPATGPGSLPAGGGWPLSGGGVDVVGLLLAINLPLAALSVQAARRCFRRIRLIDTPKR